MAHRLLFAGVALVLLIVLALNLVGRRICGSLIDMDRDSTTRRYWTIIGVQIVVIAVLVWSALSGVGSPSPS